MKRRAIDKKSYWQQVKAAAKALRGDGCTDSPDLFYRECCDEHDVHYRTGRMVDGTPISRAEADKRLFTCMQRRGKTPVMGTHVLPAFYWLAVRLFGSSAWKGD